MSKKKNRKLLDERFPQITETTYVIERREPDSDDWTVVHESDREDIYELEAFREPFEFVAGPVPTFRMVRIKRKELNL